LGRAKSLAKNSFWLTAGTGSVILIGAIYRPIIGRMLGPADYGRYSFITVFIGYFTILAYFGVRMAVVREIGRDRGNARAYLAAGFRVRIVTMAIAVVACCTVGFLLNLDSNIKVGIAILSTSLAIAGVGELLEGALLALGRSYFIAAANLTGSLLKLGVGIWALKAGYGLFGVLVVFVLTAVVTTGLDWWFVKSLLRDEKQQDGEPEFRMSMLRQSLPFVALSIATRLYTKNDILFLTMLRGNETTGIYSAAYAFIDLINAASNSVVSAVYPLVAKMHAESATALADAYERLHKYMLLGLLPVSVLLMSLGRSILVGVFGQAFMGGVPALRVLVWIPPVEVSCLISGTFLCAMYRQRLDATIAAPMTALSLIATFVMIVLFGSMGAAVATVGSGIVNALTHYVYIRRVVGPVKTLEAWLKPIACCAIMLTATQAAPESMLAIRLAAGVTAYIAAIAVIKPFDTEDKRLFRSLIKRGIA
jgi:O-antigen/teichoic acid export membrane protein